MEVSFFFPPFPFARLSSVNRLENCCELNCRFKVIIISTPSRARNRESMQWKWMLSFKLARGKERTTNSLKLVTKNGVFTSISVKDHTNYILSRESFLTINLSQSCTFDGSTPRDNEITKFHLLNYLSRGFLPNVLFPCFFQDSFYSQQFSSSIMCFSSQASG